MDPVVIIGAGQAAFQLCLSLRQLGFGGSICLVGNEGRYPYQRPPLSKDFLKGRLDETELSFRPDAFFDEMSVECHLSDPAVEIDRERRIVTLASGRACAYGHLVLATGARNRVPPIASIDAEGVVGLRTWADAKCLSERMRAGLSIAVIGAGFIGLEFASAAVEKGCAVTVVEAAPRAMGRSLSEEMSGYLVRELAKKGVDFRFGAPVEEVRVVDGRAAGIRAGGSDIAADLVLLCAGVVPNTDLAARCGLDCSRGIVVDANLRTGDPAISAIGDCASYPSARSGARLLLESVQNATGQARYLAGWLAGRSADDPYDDVPWFWSEIAKHRLQIAGAAIDADRFVVRGDPKAARFSVFRYAGDRLVAVESINAPSDHMTGRKLVANPHCLAPLQAGDPDFDLKAALA